MTKQHLYGVVRLVVPVEEHPAGTTGVLVDISPQSGVVELPPDVGTVVIVSPDEVEPITSTPHAA